jgi:hypothetical protein
MEYRYEATSIAGFIQTIAVAYVARGYFFYVTGEIPEGKDLAKVDAKLIDQYGVAVSKFTRARKKRAGQANLQYLRLKGSRLFAIFATHGQSPFYESEAKVIRDVRRVPCKFAGYSISYKSGHVQVRIEKQRYLELKAYFLEQAAKQEASIIEQEMRKLLDYEPYAPIRSQKLCIWRSVNRVRKAAGLPRIAKDCLRFYRRIVKPFDADAQSQAACA